jgi:hypothetical protein
MCSKIPPFYEDPRAFVSIADCITRRRRANGDLDVIDYGLETRAALDAIATRKKKKKEAESASIISLATIEEENEDAGVVNIETLTIENRLEKLDLRQQKGRVERKGSESQETILRHRRADAEAADGGRQQSDDVTPDQSEPPLNKTITTTRSSEDDTSIHGTTILDGTSELEEDKEEEQEEEGSKKKPKLIKDETLADTYERCFNECLPPKSGTT